MSSTIENTMSSKVWGMLLALSVLWGGSFFFVGIAVSALPPLTIVLARVGFAAVTLWIIITVLGVPRPRSGKEWLALFVMGMLNNVIPFSLIVWGQTQIPSGLASILNATTPLFTVVIAGFILPDERLTPAKLIGVLVGLIGTIYMIGPSMLSGLGGDLLAQLAVIGATISYGFGSVFGRRFKSMGLHPITTAAGQVTAATVILAPLALWIDHPFQLPMPSIEVWASLFALALFSTALAFILYFKILSSAGATNLTLVTFLIPISAILLGYFVLGERLETSHYIGMLIIGLGLSIIDGRFWKLIKS
jgi:drug/metabolite transporter (DMT)-like permease